MRDPAESTMWRISALERTSNEAASTDGRTVSSALLPSTMLSELRRQQVDPSDDDPLSVLATCIRHRHAVLLNFAHGPWLWPVTLLPDQQLYHSAHDVNDVATLAALSKLKLISAEPPKVRPPTFQFDAAAMARYRPLVSLVGALALYGPRATLLADIGGRAAYRLTPGGAEAMAQMPGALAPAVHRLRLKTASLRDIADWPGMSLERACRLLNALYLAGGLMVTRAHPAARTEPAGWRGLIGRRG